MFFILVAFAALQTNGQLYRVITYTRYVGSGGVCGTLVASAQASVAPSGQCIPGSQVFVLCCFVLVCFDLFCFVLFCFVFFFFFFFL